MPTILFNEWNELNILPISAISLKFENDNIYDISTLEAATEFRLSTINEDNDLGSTTPVAVMISGQAVLVQNNYKAFKELIKDVVDKKLINLWIKLFSEEQNSDKIIDVNGPAQYGQTPRPTLELESYSVNHEIIMKKPSPTINLSIVGYLSLDIYKTYFDNLIQQSWN